jgi:hypothetical protein
VRFVPDKAFEKENIFEFKDFLKNHFSEKATFLDFSNTPMLYFYTQRNVPSYFNQYMQNTVDEYLQRENLKKLATMEVPVVVYSNVPKSWFDCTDGVENSLRYFLIAEHIYQNYHPFAVLSKHSIWIKNGLSLRLGNYPTDTISEKPQQTELKKLAWLEGLRADKYALPNLFSWKESDIIKSGNRFEIKLPGTVDRTSGNFIEMELVNSSKEELNGLLIMSKDSVDVGAFRFVVMNKPEVQKYRIRVSTQYAWYFRHPNRLSVVVGNAANLPEIKSMHLLKALPCEN